MSVKKTLSRIVLLLLALIVLAVAAGCASKAGTQKTGAAQAAENVNKVERAEKLIRSYYSYVGKNITWESFKITALKDYESGFLAVARYNNTEGKPCAVLIKAEKNEENKYVLRSFTENNYSSGKGTGAGLAIDGKSTVLFGTAFDNAPEQGSSGIDLVGLVSDQGKRTDHKPESKDGFILVLQDNGLSSVILSAGKSETTFRKRDLPVGRMVDPRTIKQPAQQTQAK